MTAMIRLKNPNTDTRKNGGWVSALKVEPGRGHGPPVFKQHTKTNKGCLAPYLHCLPGPIPTCREAAAEGGAFAPGFWPDVRPSIVLQSLYVIRNDIT